MAASVVRSGIDDRGVVTVTLDRPEIHNAYDEQMIAALREALQRWGGDPAVRLVVLRGAGRHFQAGADLACLRRLAAAPPEVNREFSLATTDAMHLLCTLPRPTLALVHGACYGGGVGMVAACDIAIASQGASFALTEVRWGVIPAPIIPQLCAAMGVRGLRRYGITGEAFDAEEARRIGLVHEVCADEALDQAAAPVIEGILRSAPEAARASKKLVLAYAGLDLSERASAEAAEGLASFREKRDPSWYARSQP
jgi:methylglutaconyl-CoA hydratase